MNIEKVAIVTGSNKGLGYAIVRGLCEKFDGTVYLTSRDVQRGIEACKRLEEIGLKPPVFHQLDVTSTNSIELLYKHIATTHGHIDLLINNAGILFSKDSKETRSHQADQTISVNLLSLINVTETLLPLLRTGGRIINISSSSGHLSRIPSELIRRKFSNENLTVQNLIYLAHDYVDAVKESRDVSEGWGESPYVVSKVGVNTYTFMVHRKFYSEGKRIACNCVHPGYVASDMTQGVGNKSPEQGAVAPLHLALAPLPVSGVYMWHDKTIVEWDGKDPRVYIDGKIVI